MRLRERPRWRRRCRSAAGQTISEFVLIAGLLVSLAIALNAIVPRGLRIFFQRIVTTVSGIAP